MTTPNGADGTILPDGLPALLFPTSGPGQANSAGLSSRYNLTREFVESALKQRYVLDNGSIQVPRGALFDGLRAGTSLPLAIIESILQRGFDTLSDTWDSVDDALEAAAERFASKWFDIGSAQDSANYALAQLSVMNRTIKDLFDSPTAGPLSSNWDIADFGSGLGGGSIAVDALGHAVWDNSGFIAHGEIARWNADITATDYQIVSAVASTPVQAPIFGGQSYGYVFGRVNETGDPDTGVFARWGYNSVALGCLVGGTQTIFDTQSVTPANGDSWDLWTGDPGGADYHFTMLRNGRPFFETTDTSMVSQMGAGYQATGFAMYASDRNITQTSPGRLAVFSATDRT